MFLYYHHAYLSFDSYHVVFCLLSEHLCEVNALYTQVTGTKEVEASKINCNIKTIKKFSITLDYCRQLGDEKISIVQHVIFISILNFQNF